MKSGTSTAGTKTVFVSRTRMILISPDSLDIRIFSGFGVSHFALRSAARERNEKQDPDNIQDNQTLLCLYPLQKTGQAAPRHSWRSRTTTWMRIHRGQLGLVRRPGRPERAQVRILERVVWWLLGGAGEPGGKSYSQVQQTAAT